MSQHVSVTLADEQRQQLTALIRKGTAPARVQTRARVLLLADKSQTEPKTHEQISNALRISRPTISKICRNFVLTGQESALYEKPRPGKAPKITGDVEARLVLLACSAPPLGRAKWTMQLLADKLVELKVVDSISDSAVCDRLKKTRSSHGNWSGFA